MKRLQALEAENARLKREKNDSQPEKLTVTETDYKVHPMLQFQRGNRKPFAIGIKKLEAVREGWDEVLAFLAKHSPQDSNDEDLQI